MHHIARASAVIVIVSFMFVIAFAPSLVVAADEQANEITFEIVSWSTDCCTCKCDVQFSISTDLDNDGSFEKVNTSQVIYGVEHVSEPLRANISIPANQETFAFKVEAFRVDGNSSAPLFYGRNESGIIHQGANIPGFNSSWEYNYPRDQPANGSTCSLAYRYEVTGQGPDEETASSADDPSPVGDSSSPFIDPVLLGAVGLLSAAGGAGAMKLANGRSEPSPSEPQNDQDGPDAPDDPDSPTCPSCNNGVLKEGDFCHHCGARKPDD